MPTVIKKYGFRLFFYSDEGSESMHIHVRKENNFAKFWIKPIDCTYAVGFKTNELRKIKEIIFENQDLIEEKWNEHLKNA